MIENEDLQELKEREIKYFEEFLMLKIGNSLIDKLGVANGKEAIEEREELIEHLISKNKTMKNKIDDLLFINLPK
jgi:hypothetical protein